MNKTYGFNLGYVILAFLAISALQIWLGMQDVAQIRYSEFLEALDRGEITDVVVTESMVSGRFTSPQDGRNQFVSTRVDGAIAEELARRGIAFTGASDENWLTSLLSWVVPILVFFGLWVFLFRGFAERQGFGGMMTVGKSRAKVYVQTDTGVTFADVAGVDEAKSELQEVVGFLKDQDRYGRLGAHVPKGILLVGPPGTGKTLLAMAVAGEAGVPFFSISGSEFVEMFVGVGAARVRDLFEQARKAAPCIIFIDELDALGRARSAFGGLGGHDEKEQTLNQLLAELDGFDPRTGIVLLAATNRPEILDPALLRAGRFDRQVTVDRPDKRGREAILKVHLRKVTLASDADPEIIAGLTPGFTGADLANLVNEAAIVATRRGADAVANEDFSEAVERIVAGSAMKSRLLNPAERKRIAYHEMGHALVAAALPGSDPVHKVSIIPRSIGALGYTLQRPTEDRFLITTGELDNRMAVLLAGRAAEDLIYGEVSTGAADDLAKATDIARQIVMRFGMDPDVGQAVLEDARPTFLDGPAGPSGSRDFSEATAREVDLAVRRRLAHAFDRARTILTERQDDLAAGARLLLARETLTPDDFPALKPIALPDGDGAPERATA
ncbi:MAG TPA: ATP-dependent zinc metalloprotease FtsH [Methylomirabilota bacterium]|nr:ATP-dependent zinc metalloprotease FtsH [Methylomirabilota bacterium]